MANNNVNYALQLMLQGSRRQLMQTIYSDLATCLGGCYSITTNRVTYKSGMTGCGSGNVAIPYIASRAPASWHEPGTEIIGNRMAIGMKKLEPDQILETDVAVPIEEYYTAFGALRPSKWSVPVAYIPHLNTPICQAIDTQNLIMMIRAARGHYKEHCQHPLSHLLGKSGYGNNCGSDPITAPNGAPFQTAEGVAKARNYSPAFRLPLNFTEEQIRDVFIAALCHFDQLGWAGTWSESGGIKRDVYVFVHPYIWGKLVGWGMFMNRDYGGLGSIAYGTLPYVLGFDIINTPNLPGWQELQIYDYSQTNVNRRQFLDFTPPIHAQVQPIMGKYAIENPQITAMIFAHRKTVGRIVYDGINYVEEEGKRRLSPLGIAYAMTGGDILCPEGAIEVAFDEPPFYCGTGCANIEISGFNNPVDK